MANQKLQVARAAAVTQDDNVDIPFVGGGDINWPCVLYVGTAGDLRVMTAGGDDVIFYNVTAGSFIPVQVTRVFDTDTAAGNIVALW